MRLAEQGFFAVNMFEDCKPRLMTIQIIVRRPRPSVTLLTPENMAQDLTDIVERMQHPDIRHQVVHDPLEDLVRQIDTVVNVRVSRDGGC